MRKLARRRSAPASDAETMRSEYDFSAARRGMTCVRYAQGSNVVVLDPDVAKLFPTAAAANSALRALGAIIRQFAPRPRTRTGRKPA